MKIYKTHFLDSLWGNKKLDMMLETQRAFFDKDGLGFDNSTKETHLKKFFPKSNDSHDTSSKCAYVRS